MILVSRDTHDSELVGATIQSIRVQRTHIVCAPLVPLFPGRGIQINHQAPTHTGFPESDVPCNDDRGGTSFPGVSEGAGANVRFSSIEQLSTTRLSKARSQVVRNRIVTYHTPDFLRVMYVASTGIAERHT